MRNRIGAKEAYSSRSGSHTRKHLARLHANGRKARHGKGTCVGELEGAGLPGPASRSSVFGACMYHTVHSVCMHVFRACTRESRCLLTTTVVRS